MKTLFIVFALCIASTFANPILEERILNEISTNLEQMITNMLTNLIASINLGKRDALLERGITEMVINAFGLGSVWEKITSVGSDLSSKLIKTLASLLFKGKAAWELSKPILGVMISELKDNSISAAQAVAQAIADLASIAAGIVHIFNINLK